MFDDYLLHRGATGVTECSRITKGGVACKATTAWRCRSCYRATCGVHIMRNAEGAFCTYCNGPVHQFRRRINGRRLETP